MGAWQKNSAATYSPAQSPVQYHRRWRAVRCQPGLETGEDARQKSGRYTRVCGGADNEADSPGSGSGGCRITSVFGNGDGRDLSAMATEKQMTGQFGASRRYKRYRFRFRRDISCACAGTSPPACAHQKKAPMGCDPWGLGKKIRRRPTLPHSRPCSTIGAGELNFRVRNGNGWDLSAMATEKSGYRTQDTGHR